MYFLYFDAGIAAMVVQAVVAAAAGIVLFSKGMMYRIKSFFGLVRENKDTYDSIDFEEQGAENDDHKE